MASSTDFSDDAEVADPGEVVDGLGLVSATIVSVASGFTSSAGGTGADLATGREGGVIRPGTDRVLVWEKRDP